MMMLLTTTPESPADNLIDNPQNSLRMIRKLPAVLLDVEVDEPQPVQVSFVNEEIQPQRSELSTIAAQAKHKKSFSFSDRVHWSSDQRCVRKCSARGDRLKKSQRPVIPLDDLSELFGKKIRMATGSTGFAGLTRAFLQSPDRKQKWSKEVACQSQASTSNSGSFIQSEMTRNAKDLINQSIFSQEYTSNLQQESNRYGSMMLDSHKSNYSDSAPMQLDDHEHLMIRIPQSNPQQYQPPIIQYPNY